MKRCPENDKILPFCERELSEVEQAQFELHLKTCSECRHEVEQSRADDALLREGVEEAFARHRVTGRIMQQIRNSKPDELPANNHLGWRYFWLTAFALLTIIAIVSLYTPSTFKHHGRAEGVMLQALNDDATLQGQKLAADHTFDLATFEPAELDGCFLFTVTAGQTSVFKMSGKADVRRSEDMLEFYNSEASFELISGARLTIIINGKQLQLERKNLSTASPAGISDLQSDKISLAGIDKPLVASTTIETNDIITDGAAEIDLPGTPTGVASATTGLTAEAGAGSESLINPPQGPGKNPFADEPLDLDGN